MKETIALPLAANVIRIAQSGIFQLSAVQANISNPVIIEVDTNEFSVNLALPQSTDGQSPLITIVDIGGNASGQPIGIFVYGSFSGERPLNSDLINGYTSGQITVNGGIARIDCVTTGFWLATGTFSQAIG